MARSIEIHLMDTQTGNCVQYYHHCAAAAAADTCVFSDRLGPSRRRKQSRIGDYWVS